MGSKISKLYEQKSKTSKQESVMSKLLGKKSVGVKGFKKGDNVAGKITKITRDEILVDLGGKTEARVLEKDRLFLANILATLKVGDTVEVYILNPESDQGFTVVSLRKYMQEKTWSELKEKQKKQELVDGRISDEFKGGYAVQVSNGLSAFLPYSNLISGRITNTNEVIQVYITDLKKEDNKIIVSQKKAISDEDAQIVSSTYKKDQKIKAKIKTITNFGIFTSLPFKSNDGKSREIDGLIHVSEASWDKIDLDSSFSAGDEIEVIVIGFDSNSKRLDLSIKRLNDDPFTEIKSKYPVDARVKGVVTDIKSGNIHVRVDDMVDAMIKKEKLPPDLTYKPGDEVSAIVTDYDNRRRILLLVPQLLKKSIGYR